MNPGILILAGLALFLLLKKNSGGSSVSVASKRAALVQWAGSDYQGVTDPFNRMSDSEINSTYEFVFNYLVKGITTLPDYLRQQMTAISLKYNIFS